ncbi:MAG TPA: nuclear transport factor 2 family protein [Acidimicrobiales bacterium]|nr:nuclear transport factor 2 family protein [Acidimicrobiales bacterium]
MVDDAEQIADALFGAIEGGDLDAVAALYSPDVEVWLNTDGIARGRDENLRTLGWVVANLTDRRYEEIRRHRTDTGVVQQHVLRATTAAGRRVAVPACMVITIDGGRITRLEEYLDSAHIAELTAP